MKGRTDDPRREGRRHRHAPSLARGEAAPCTSIAARAASFGEAARTAKGKTAAMGARVSEQSQVALVTAGVTAGAPGYDPSPVMGDDLERVMPAFRARCSVPSIAVVEGALRSGGTSFAGLASGWASTPGMSAFPAADAPAVAPGFTPRRPPLIVQGTVDPLVLEPPTTGFVAKRQATGTPVTHERCPGADHSTIIRQADADVRAFLAARF